MTETLDSLHRAVIASPADRTVRLVYADALEETGETVQIARAEFIRGQIELESAAADTARAEVLADRCRELFMEHWLAWWSPVAAAAGLPAPHVPGQRIRDRIARAVRRRRRRRPANWPYSITTAEPSVHLAEYGMVFRFAGGFPEEVRFLNFDIPDGGPELVHRWGEAIPLVRFVLDPLVNDIAWETLTGPHLGGLEELTFQTVHADVVPRIAASPWLANLRRLAIAALGVDPGAIRAIVARPVWEKLVSLKFTGRLGPDDLRDVAQGCTLQNLEEFEVRIGNPVLFPSQAGEAMSELLSMFLRAVATPEPETTRWVEYGPAVEALAAAEWVRRLRVLRIVAGSGLAVIGAIDRLLGTTEGRAGTIPDAAVLALASALDRDKLERLVLPAAVVGPSVREELTTRLGGKLMFT